MEVQKESCSASPRISFLPLFSLGSRGGERRNLLNIQFEGLSSRNLVDKNLDEQTAKVNHKEKNMKILIFE